MNSLHERCLALTGSFETGKMPPACFSGLAGNFDGQGMSLGALQWNIGQGTLQPLLQEMLAQHPDMVFDELQAMLALPTREAQVDWCVLHHDRHWSDEFTALGQTAEFQQIQVDASGKYYSTAQALCLRFGLSSDRGMALMFDIAVQNGTISTTTEGLIRAECASLPDEIDWLRSIANRRAEASNPKYVEDVRARKLTIANGIGIVHGLHYDLAGQFGIGLVPAAVT